MAAPTRIAIDRAWLASRGLLPRVRRELFLDQTIASIDLEPAEQEAARSSAESRWNDASAQFESHGIKLQDVVLAEERALRVRKFQVEKWKGALPGYFLQRKSALDEVVYWLLRTKDPLLARELYFRIKEGEADFATIATEHSQGVETNTSGLLGPVSIDSLAPPLARLLLESQPGMLRSPVQIGEWIVVVKLHRILPCRLDAAMETRLYDELLESWIAEHLAGGKEP